MSLAGCQINPIGVNFHLKKSLEIMIRIQLTKSNPKITSGVSVPCLMQIRVKFAFLFFTIYHVQGSIPAVLEWGRAVQQDVNFLCSMIAKNPLT